MSTPCNRWATCFNSDTVNHINAATKEGRREAFHLAKEMIGIGSFKFATPRELERLYDFMSCIQTIPESSLPQYVVLECSRDTAALFVVHKPRLVRLTRSVSPCHERDPRTLDWEEIPFCGLERRAQ